MKKLGTLLVLVLVLLFGLSPASAIVGMDAFVKDTGNSELRYVPIPAAYEVKGTIKNLGDAGFLNHPDDLFVAPDDTLYIADTDNNRVLHLSTDGTVIDIIQSACGQKLKKPPGVYVHTDGSVWIADYGNLRIATLNADLSDRKVYVKPDSSLLGQNFTFDVQKIFVANTGYIYALKGANLITLDEGNNFRGYLGADKVGFSLSRFLTRLFGSKSQVERTVKQEPASYSNFFIGSDNMIYGILSNKNTAQIRKLNTVGTNTYPEETYGFVLPDTTGGKKKMIEPTFSDITVEDNGIITLVDRSTGLIYQYDQEGNLLCCFGGLGNAKGLFQLPVSLDADSRGNLYVLDYQAGTITIFEPTYFISLVHQAVSLHGEGRYDEAIGYWEKALEIDSNYALAHQGVAKIMGKRENWQAALRSYELANDKEGYSVAFSEYRHEYFRNHFFLVVALTVVIAAVFIKLISLIKRKTDGWANDVQMGRGLK